MRTFNLYAFSALIVILQVFGCNNQTSTGNGTSGNVVGGLVDEEASSRSDMFCLNWNDVTYPSYLFYQENFGEKYKLDTLIHNNGRLCAIRDTSVLNHFFVLPSGGKTLDRQQIRNNVAISSLDTFKYIVLHENVPSPIIPNNKEDRINDALKAFYANFQVEFQFKPVDNVNWQGESIDNGISNLIDEHGLEIEAYNHFIVPNTQLFRTANLTASGFQYTYNESTEIYAGYDSLLYKQFLTLHELCHFNLTDGIQGSGLTDAQNIVILALMSNSVDYCRYYIDLPNIFKMHGLNGLLAPDEVQFTVNDLEISCILSSEIQAQVLCPPPCTVADIVINDYILPINSFRLADQLTLNSFQNTLVVGNGRTIGHAYRNNYNEIARELELHFLPELNEILNTNFKVKDLEMNRSQIRKAIVAQQDSLSKPVINSILSSSYTHVILEGKRKLLDKLLPADIPYGIDTIELYRINKSKKKVSVFDLFEKKNQD